VIGCLSNHIPKIYDESLDPDHEIVFMRHKGAVVKSIVNFSSIQQTSSSSSASSSSPMSTSSSSDSFKKMLPPSSSPAGTVTVTTANNEKHHITLPLLIPDKIEYCITGLYNLDTFMLIMPTLLEIMFYETE
jgi:hypothetical protein